jgi:F-type H+-transporting ATPase subunit gamma
MTSLRNIKIKIQSYKKTGTVTRAMEAVSAVKMRKGQDRAIMSRMYAAAGLSVLERLSGLTDISGHVFTQSQPGKVCFVVVTSDKGLAGALNSGVIKLVDREISSRNIQREDVIMIAIGRRGGDYFAARGYDVRIKKENISDNVMEEDMRTITDQVLTWYAQGEIGETSMAYTNFVSTFEQLPVLRTIMPLKRETIDLIVADLRPVKGKYAGLASRAIPVATNQYTIEPSPDVVLSMLLPRLINIAVFHALLEAKASEHSARMVAMKSATDKAKDMTQQFTRTFNKVRQAGITREVSEITSGMEAMG